jgi:outer membrane protein
MLVLGASLSGVCALACAFDPLLTQGELSVTPADAFDAVCDTWTPDARQHSLQLGEAVNRALCANPKTRQAWAGVKARAAALGTARAAYLPTISANLQGVREHSVISIDGHPSLGSDTTANVHSESVSLNWLLFDFGGRAAAVKQAEASLEALRATQDATLQDVFAATTKAYYEARTAREAFEAASEIETMTRDSMVAAQARVDKGIAPVSDALQAQTQYEQAVLARTRAERDAHIAVGKLASEMNLDPDTPLSVAPATGEIASAGFSDSIGRLIGEVKAVHPSVRAAQANYDAALAKVALTRSQGLPTATLMGRYSRNGQPQSMGLGLPSYPASGRDAYIGVQITIPLFEGFGRHYRVTEAQAQVELQSDVLDEVRQQVALDVWCSYQTLTSATLNTKNTANLLDIALRAWDAAKHRYDAGVGNILELTGTQAALANAKFRRIEARGEWDIARVDLAAKLGVLTREDLR